MNTFYLKTILWVPPNHMFNFYRELLYAMCGACGMKEMYLYLGSRLVARVVRFVARVVRFVARVVRLVACVVRLIYST